MVRRAKPGRVGLLDSIDRLEMDAQFRLAMTAAIEAGAEHCATEPSTHFGTQAPIANYSALTIRCRKLRRSSAAVATSREGHRSPRSGRAGQHRRWDRERGGLNAEREALIAEPWTCDVKS